MAGKLGHFFLLSMVVLSLLLLSLSAEAIRPSVPEMGSYEDEGGCKGRGDAEEEEEEGCLMRRFMAVAHTDYIYTQDVNLHVP
ncbi:hypothetical protein LINGRAHAP2_LOCUS33817 [Linum grandiflorum]